MEPSTYKDWKAGDRFTTKGDLIVKAEGIIDAIQGNKVTLRWWIGGPKVTVNTAFLDHVDHVR